jgi:serine/threonine protein kinase
MSFDTEIQELIPGYRLIARLGAGGFGEVWKAEAPGGLFKAVKIINGCLSDCMPDQARLTQELKSLHRVKTIRHPYLLSLDRIDIVDGRLIIISELADCTLFDRFKEYHSRGHAGIPRVELLDYMKEVAEVLDLMNERFNLQHLDIKPQNIFLLFNHVKVGDFGLVKDLEGSFAAITSGVTAMYAAPETFEGVVSRFSDQYNLAMVYQEMLTSKLPFDGTTARHLMMQHMKGTPNLSALPAADQPVVARALSKNPSDRFASCLEFVRALCQSSGGDAAVLEREATPAAPPTVETIAERPDILVTPLEPAPSSFGRLGVKQTPDIVSVPTSAADDGLKTTMNRPTSLEKPGARDTEVIAYVPPPPPPECPETTGDGVMMPALVIGLGGLGSEVLQEFRKSLRKRDASEIWPHIRLLNIDTDPEPYERAKREPNSVLAAEEFLVTSYHRISHFMKRQAEREELARWLPLNQLASVARDQTTAAGWRALGRLAFVSSEATLATRLRQELHACADETNLQDVSRRTGLGLRTTRPRVYVVTSLTGGTGSGMVLDVAAALRRELIQLGHARAELVAVLLAPAVKGNVEARGVANAFAALSELKHFAAAAKDAGKPAPFDRCVVLPLPAKTEGAVAMQELVSLAGEFLSRELTTAMGREADAARTAWKQSHEGPQYQSFGAYWFSVPRRPLLRRVVQHICDRVVRSWGVHDAEALDAYIKTWSANQLGRANLSSEGLLARLQEALASRLGQPPSEWLSGLMQGWGKGEPGDVGQGAGAIRMAMTQLESLLGPAEREPDVQLGSSALTALAEASRSLSEAANRLLAELALDALSEPRFRLACMEEAAVEQIRAALDCTAQGLKKRSAEQHQRSGDLLQQIPPHVTELMARGIFRGKARTRAADAIRMLLGQYLIARWDSALARAAWRVCQDLHENLHKHRRAVNCCHKRISQFLKTFDDSTSDAPTVDLGLGRYLLPFGCRTLNEAVERIIGCVPPEEENTLHDEIWKLIHSMLQDNVHVCTAPTALFRSLREQIDLKAQKVAEQSLGRAHAAEVYLERQADHTDADAELATAFDEAKPELMHGRDASREFTILAVPPGPEGARFCGLVRHALPDVQMHTTASTDDIVFYREQAFASLDELPQLCAAAREQYAHVLSSAQFGPHSRIDNAW